MMRLLASLILLAHLGALTGPAMGPQLERQAGRACEVASAHAHLSALTAPADCEACAMPFCDAMLSCTSVTVAVVTGVKVRFVPALARASEADPPVSERGLLSPPPPPPPQA